MSYELEFMTSLWKNKSIKLPFVTKNNKWWRFVSSNWIYSLVKNRSVKLPFLTKNSKHLRETSAHDSSPLIKFTPLWKTRVSSYPLTKTKNISLHLHTGTKQLPHPNILYTLKLQATICDLYLNLLVVKIHSIKLPFVTSKKKTLPICLLLTHELLQNAKLISLITGHTLRAESPSIFLEKLARGPRFF